MPITALHSETTELFIMDFRGVARRQQNTTRVLYAICKKTAPCRAVDFAAYGTRFCFFFALLSVDKTDALCYTKIEYRYSNLGCALFF